MAPVGDDDVRPTGAEHIPEPEVVQDRLGHEALHRSQARR
jgi:hypothetical protein